MREIDGGVAWIIVVRIIVGVVIFALGVYNGCKDTSQGAMTMNKIKTYFNDTLLDNKSILVIKIGITLFCLYQLGYGLGKFIFYISH